MITKIQQAARLVDTSFIGRFLLRLFAYYFFFRMVNWLWIGLITPEGYYSQFIDRYLDYVNLIKHSILSVGAFLSSLLGVSSVPLSDSTLQVANGGSIRMAWACCGLEIMSFWAAFVLADTTPKSTKAAWGLGGLFSIWLINCLRVTLLLLAKNFRWEELLHLDQHFLFNAVAYCFVLLLSFIYYKKNKQIVAS